ncbi:hypothetical protein, partial [Streptococcus pseudopneumoniae]|uniref:hypothetical protein n=1 Tax=Streptococcus pseudopneumoniae TaxID=257758 RepID=UPI001BB229C5
RGLIPWRSQRLTLPREELPVRRATIVIALPGCFMMATDFSRSRYGWKDVEATNNVHAGFRLIIRKRV